ncbi:MAG: DUF1501 domain-containing protein [Thermoanaerobaculia bacterium]
MEQSRRDFFFRTSCAALGAAAFSAGVEHFGLISALAEEQAPTDYKALVCIFLSGGNDSNNCVVPLHTTGYNQYLSVRGSAGLAIPQGNLLPVTPPSMGLPFGLHPNLTGLHQLWNLGKMAVVTNVGPLIEPTTRTTYRNGTADRPYQLFSHSDQVTQSQTGRPDTRSQTGWAGRVADRTISLNGGSAFPMVTSITGSAVFGIGVNTRPLAIGTGPLNTVLVLSGFNTTPEAVARRNQMDFLRTIDRAATLIKSTGDTTQQALSIGAAFSVDPTLTVTFPNTGLGNQLRQVAKVIKLNQTAPALSLNRQIFFCSIGGFDTHQNQLGSHVTLLGQLSAAMKAFYDEMVAQGLQDRVTQFTLSDFGRTFQPAGGGGVVGTDHGWGSHQFVAGGSVIGGNFYGVPHTNGTIFPSLVLSGPDDTDSRGRWIPTAAVDQYAGTLASWFGLSPADLPLVFPLIGRFTTPNLGFMA